MVIQTLTRKSATMSAMAARQGLNRLLNGTKKKITDSEANRGYFFVTNDVLAKNKLGKLFDVRFGKFLLKDRHVDSYGRISVGRVILRDFKDKPLFMKIEARLLVVNASQR